MEAYVGCHGQQTEIELRANEPDLLVEFSLARAHGRNLVGSEPESLIGHVPAKWINAYGEQLLARWQQLTDDDRHAELMVLTACRIWQFAEERMHSSKSGAAQWARARDPSLTAVEKALDRRAGGTVTIGADEIGRVLAAAHAAVAEQL